MLKVGYVVITADAMTLETKESDLEVALQAYLKSQIAEFGYALVDNAELTPIALGDGWYACRDAATAVYWITQDHADAELWRVERVPGGGGRYRGDTERFRIYHLEKSAPCGTPLVFKDGFVQ